MGQPINRLSPLVNLKTPAARKAAVSNWGQIPIKSLACHPGLDLPSRPAPIKKTPRLIPG